MLRLGCCLPPHQNFWLRACIVLKLAGMRDKQSLLKLAPDAKKMKVDITRHFVVWDSSPIHCLDALNLGAGVEQPFDCFIIQNRQAVQSTRRSVGWILEDNMVDTSYTSGAKTSDTGADVVKPDRHCCWEDHSGGWVPVSGMKIRSLLS